MAAVNPAAVLNLKKVTLYLAGESAYDGLGSAILPSLYYVNFKFLKMANQNLFNSIQMFKPKKNVFDLSHDVKLSLDMGYLYPTLVQECIPGDHFTIGCDSLLRFAPLVSPVMHRMDVTMHYFFVPNRILWDDWEKYITGDDTLVHPSISYTPSVYAANPLFDYLGLPATTDADVNVNAFPFAAYQCIYNEYYRDQNLIAPINYKLDAGINVNDRYITMRRRAWQHDYFTAALPFAQKGPAVEIPIGELTDAPVYRNTTGTLAQWNVTTGGSQPLMSVNETVSQNPPDNPPIADNALYADMSQVAAESTSINDLRRAFRLQEWLEKNARAGTRYVESILAHFGVKSPDARLNRPEYITGTKSPVIISEVLNTSGETDGLPQGNMAGHGVSVTTGKYGKYFCQEHGFIIGVMSVLPLPAYQQGVPKHFLRSDKFDYFWPEFAHIGEQEVLNKEIYVNSANPDATFGYVPRYSEYKYAPSRVAGDFKTSLDFWHLGRIFATEPALNQTFVECDPGKRIFAVEAVENSLYAHVLHRIKAVRPMPKFGTPSF